MLSILFKALILLFILIIPINNFQFHKYPMHLVDVLWIHDYDKIVNEIKIEFTIDNDIADDSYMYICPIYCEINKIPFYIGLATYITDAFANNKDFSTKAIGRGVVFARWKTLNEANVRIPMGSYFYSTQFERGDYVSVRTPLKWGKGKFSVTIIIEDLSRADATNNHSWLHAAIYDQDNNKYDIGSIMIEGGNCRMNDTIYTFIEMYKNPIKQPAFNYHMSGILINGKPLDCRSVLSKTDANVFNMSSSIMANGKLIIKTKPSKDITNSEVISKIK